MSILIKGMDMPVEGLVTVNIHSDGLVYVHGAYPTELHEAVSVPTPHGRLIDANALADDFRGHIALYDSCPFSQLSFTDKARRDELQSSLAEVINALAIIEAEEGEEE